METIFCEVKNDIIINTVVASQEIADLLGLLPYIEGRQIGDRYDGALTNEKLTKETISLTAKIMAMSDYIDFLEECIVEMAGKVYTELSTE